MKRVFDDLEKATGFASGVCFVNDSSVVVNKIEVHHNKYESYYKYAVDITLKEEEEEDYDESYMLDNCELSYINDVPKETWSVW